jgi:hypothetical protein
MSNEKEQRAREEPRTLEDEPTDGPTAQKNREKMQRQQPAEGRRRD